MSKISHYCRIFGIRKGPEYLYQQFDVLPKISSCDFCDQTCFVCMELSSKLELIYIYIYIDR